MTMLVGLDGLCDFVRLGAKIMAFEDLFQEPAQRSSADPLLRSRCLLPLPLLQELCQDLLRKLLRFLTTNMLHELLDVALVLSLSYIRSLRVALKLG